MTPYRPRPITLKGSVAGTEVGKMFTPVEGYYMDVMVIVEHAGTATVKALDSLSGNEWASGAGSNQTVLRFFVEQAQNRVPVVIQISGGPVAFDYLIMVSYGETVGKE